MRFYPFLPILLVSAAVTGSLAESVAGLKWTAPAGWTNDGTRPMRAATYKLTGTGGESAECVVYFFGEGKGGSVEANMDRWKGQMLAPDGKPAQAAVKKETIHGLAVTTIESQGTYTGMGGPMATEHTEVKGYRLMGAIIEGPGGNVFVKFAGPEKLVSSNRQKFQQLLESFQKE